MQRIYIEFHWSQNKDQINNVHTNEEEITNVYKVTKLESPTNRQTEGSSDY